MSAHYTDIAAIGDTNSTRVLTHFSWPLRTRLPGINEVQVIELAPQGIGPGKVYVSDKVREMMNDWMLERFGVIEGVLQVNGHYMADCCVCGRRCDTNCEPEEFDPDMHYCGGSPRCCP